MEWRIPLSAPDLGPEEEEAVLRVLRSGWLTMGPETAAFEREFAVRAGVRHASAVANATVALHLANAALGIGPGDEVLCPALTFVATAAASRMTGAEVVFADSCGPHDLTVDPADLERRLTPRTRAVTVMHYGGHVCRMDEILAFARARGLRVIEDAAHAPLARHRFPDGSLRFAGAIGDVGCFSFYGNKNMTTGEGGMVTTDDAEIADRIKALRSHCMTTLTYERHRTVHASGYDVTGLGYNYRMDELHAALGRVQLAKLERLNAERRRVTALYRAGLAGIPGLVVPFADRDLELSACHIMPVAFDRPEDLARVKRTLAESRIQTSKHYDLIPAFTGYRNRTDFRTRHPALDNLLTLPLYPAMTEAMVDEVCGRIRECLGG